MDCSVIEIDLVPYHLATCDEETRATIDEHLVACTSCLRAYLAVKRHLDRGAAARPSDDARARLRAAIAAEFRPTLAARAARALRRPIPLYQGLAAAAAIALVITAVAPLVQRGPAPEPSIQASGARLERIDTARPTPANLSVY